MKRIENKTFSPNETVVLDGCAFINCVFDGCEVIFGAENSVTYENCTTDRPPRVMLCGAAQRTLDLLRFFGFTLTSPFGEEPQETSLQ
jgi:hypothetical protein